MQTTKGELKMAIVQSDIVLADGDILNIESGELVIGTIVNSGGSLTVSSGGTADSAAVCNGGNLTVSLRGAANNATVHSGGNLTVSGGTADNAIVSSGGIAMVVENGVMEDATVFFGGSMFISSGGTANNAVVRGTIDRGHNALQFNASDGGLIVSSGGTANSTLLIHRGRLVLCGGTANDIRIIPGGIMFISGGVASGISMLGGNLTIYNGGSADNIIADRAVVIVSQGGTATNIIENGGCVSAYGDVTFLSNTFSGRDFEEGDVATVHSGTTAVNIQTDCLFRVFSGGVLNSANINISGDLRVEEGGLVDSVIVNSRGSLTVSSGGSLTGRIVCFYGAKVSVNGAILNFDLTRVAPGIGARVNDLGVLSGCDYVITVDADQAEGDYTLAENAAWFNGSITVVNKAGEELGTLTLSETAVISDQDYTLVLSDGVLSLKVGDDPVPTASTLDGSILSGGKSAAISSGETIRDILVVSRGVLTVSDGGTAVGATVNSGGSIVIENGGTADSTTVNAHYYWNGSYAGNSSAALIVQSGGTATNTTVKMCGSMDVVNGGTAENIYLNGGLSISSGGTANNVMANDCGALKVDGGGTANSITVEIGGGLRVDGGGTATVITENGGYVKVANGATATFVSNSFSGLNCGYGYSATVHSGTTATDIAIGYSGGFEVHSGGIANGITVSSGGRVDVYSGGIASGIIVESSGKLYVSEGGTAVVTITNPWQTMSSCISGAGTVIYQYDAGVYCTSRVSADGSGVFKKADFMDSLRISGEYRAVVCSGGIMNRTVIESYGSLAISSGGTAKDTILNSGGWLTIYSGGTADGIIFGSNNGDYKFYAGATVNNATIDSGGNLNVNSGIAADSASVNAGGSMSIGKAATAKEIKENGGYVSVDRNADVTFASHSFNGLILGQAQNQFRAATVHSGTTAVSADISAGGSLLIFEGGLADHTTINRGGKLTISSGGTANHTTINSGVLFNVSAGITADYAVVNVGATLRVIKGGTANKVSINSEGVLIVYDGGTAADATVNANGFIDVSSGGILNNITANGGYLYISSGGTAGNVSINSEGVLIVYEGGTAADATVNSNSFLDVSSGGVASGITVASDGQLEVSGGKVTGKMTFEDGAVVSMYEDAILDFDLTRAEVGAEALVNDLSVVQGTPLYTLTVSDDQEKGIYILAEGSAAFDSVITVQNTLEETIGTLTVDGSLETENRRYTLNLTDDILSITCYVLIKDQIISNDVSVVQYEIYRNPVVNNGGKLDVSSGGTASEIAENGGYVILDTGAEATFVPNTIDELMLEDASATIHSGTTLTNATVNSGGKLYIYSGGTAVEILENGGYVSVDTGAEVTFVPNTIDKLVLESASATVHSGTTVNSAVVNPGGRLEVFTGGTAPEILENGGYVLVPGSVEAVFTPNIIDGLVLKTSATVHSGTTACNITVDGGGLYISSGGTANSTTVSGGRLMVSSGGTALNTIFSEHGYSFVRGGTMSNTAVQSFGSIIVSQNGTADNTTVNSQGRLVIHNGTVNNTTVNSGGSMVMIMNTGTANNTTVNSGGRLDIRCGTMNDTTIAVRGSFSIGDGVTMNDTIVSGGTLVISSQGTANNTTVNGGFLYNPDGRPVFSGSGCLVVQDGTVNNTTVGSGGNMFVSGGTANHTTVGSGGALYISSGGTATGIAENGGFVSVGDGADVTFTSATFSGLILDRTSATVHSGTTANSVTVYDAGKLYVYSGGVLTGRIVRFGFGGNISMFEGATVDFDLTQIAPGAEARITNLAGITGTPDWTITVNADQAEGIYSLAGKAKNFNNTITVVNRIGDKLGTLTVGGTTVISDKDYTLSLSDDGLLSLKIGEALSPSQYTSDGLVLSGQSSVNSGEVFHDTLIGSAGKLKVGDGGMTTNTLIISGGSLIVFSGGTANDTIVYSRGCVSVMNGGSADNITIHSGGTLTVFSGTVNDTTVESGGYASGISLESGRILTVSSGGTAHNITVSSGGIFNVSSGGAIISATVMDGGCVSGISLNDGSLQVFSGGTADGMTISRYGSMVVLRGGKADNTTINTGGSLLVSSGGIGNNTTVESGGYASGVTIESGGTLTVSSGGTAAGTTVNSGGSMFVSGGTMDRITVNSGGSMFVSEGTASNTTVNRGGYATGIIVAGTSGRLTVSSGGTADNITVNSGCTLTVYNGGTATVAVTNPWKMGKITSSQGATVLYQYDAGVYYGENTNSGVELVDKADVMSGLGINRSGSAIVFSGGILESAGVAGSLIIYSGGIANSTVVCGGGSFGVLSGGTASHTTIQRNGRLILSSGCVMNDVTIESGASMVVSGHPKGDSFDSLPGVTVNDVIISSGGSLRVLRGGTATNVIFNGINNLSVETGGTATVAFNPWQPGISYNNEAKPTIIWLERDAGVYYGCDYGRYRDYGFISKADCMDSLVIDLYCRAIVYSGGTANNARITDGGRLMVSSGGTALDIDWTPCRGELSVENGACVTFVSRYSGVYYNSGSKIFSADVVESRTLRGNETMCVLSGGTAICTTIDSGALYVSSGGTATGAYISSGGAYVSSGATVTGLGAGFGAYLMLTVAPDTYVQGTSAGKEFEIKDALLSGYTVGSGGVNVLSGGTATDVFVSENGFVNVSSGGTVNSVTIDSHSWLYVYSGGTVNDPIASGTLYVYSGGTATFTFNPWRSYTSNNIHLASGAVFINYERDANVYYGRQDVGVVDKVDVMESWTIASGYSAIVYSDGIATDTTVDSGGWIKVSSGGTATNIAAASGAYLGLTVASDTYIQGTSGGIAFEMKDATLSNFVFNNGSATIESGGRADNIVVNSHCGLYVFFGGEVDNTTVNSEGVLQIISGGSADNTAVTSGGRFVLDESGVASGISVNADGQLEVSGGKVTGKMTFEEGAVVSMSEDAVLDFDLTQAESGGEALVNDLSVIQGMPLYTLTVNTNMTGTYDFTLADGAAEFNSMISVVNKFGDELGTLTVGETVKIGYNDYTLNLAESTLSVTIEAPDLTPQTPVGTTEQVSWEATGADRYIVEYSTDNFEHVIQIVTTASATDMLELPAGTYQWRVKADENSDWAVGEAIVSEADSGAPKVVQAAEDGSDDLFFATPEGTWSNIFYAQHVGSINDWDGTKEVVSAKGRGRIQNLFFGSADPNVLCLTDAENGDGIFVDDVYTDLPEEVAEHTARLYRIQEIRAGAGDDIVDMTSQRFEYVGDGLTIRGGDGDDVIWANKGDNRLFGDDGNDRIVGASGNDAIAGGIGDDSLHGGGGDDIFTFCDNWGSDTVEQIETGTVTLWFVSGSESNWNAETLTYTDGENSVSVSGVSAEQVTLKFGNDGSEQFSALSDAGAFDAFTSRRIFEESGSGLLAGV